MATITETTSGTVNGQPVVLQTTTGSQLESTLDYSVSISTTEVSQDINIALALDVSGSAGSDSGTDIDGDGVNETVLEVEIAAAKDLYQSFFDAGYSADELEITLVSYNGRAETLGTYNMNDQAAYDAALDSLSTGGMTNFGAALTEVINTWDATTTDADPNNDVTADDTNHLIFLSDGYSNGGWNWSSQLSVLSGTYDATISAIGVGEGSSLWDLNQIDNTDSAVQVTDLATLTDAIVTPPPAVSHLQEVEVFIDGTSYGVFTPGDGTLESTTFGFAINHDVLSGYSTTPGQELNFEVVARFDGGEEFSTAQTLQVPLLVCFAGGTLIRTPNGYRPVETLHPGDEVCVEFDRVAPLRWVGHRHLTAEDLQHAPKMRPIRIRADAFGPGQPFEDLYVSRQHRVLVDDWFTRAMYDADDGVLAPAHALANGGTITEMTAQGGVTYYHLLFDAHEIVDSQGLATESFLPRAWVVDTLHDEAQEEILALFPRFREALKNGLRKAAPMAPARPILTAREARLMVPFLTEAAPANGFRTARA